MASISASIGCRSAVRLSLPESPSRVRSTTAAMLATATSSSASRARVGERVRMDRLRLRRRVCRHVCRGPNKVMADDKSNSQALREQFAPDRVEKKLQEVVEERPKARFLLD